LILKDIFLECHVIGGDILHKKEINNPTKSNQEVYISFPLEQNHNASLISLEYENSGKYYTINSNFETLKEEITTESQNNYTDKFKIDYQNMSSTKIIYKDIDRENVLKRKSVDNNIADVKKIYDLKPGDNIFRYRLFFKDRYEGKFFVEVYSSDYKLYGLLDPYIAFEDPTVADNGFQIGTSYVINISIEEENLAGFVYNWNGTNYTIYDDSLILMMNFDDDYDTYIDSFDSWTGNEPTNWTVGSISATRNITECAANELHDSCTGTGAVNIWNDAQQFFPRLRMDNLLVAEATYNFQTNISAYSDGGLQLYYGASSVFVGTATGVYSNEVTTTYDFIDLWGRPGGTGNNINLTVSNFQWNRIDVQDHSLADNDGIASNITTNIIGKYDKAIEFNGIDGHITIADDNSLGGMSELTVSVWYYPKSTGEGGFGRLVEKSNAFYIFLSSPVGRIIPNIKNNTNDVIDDLVDDCYTLNTWNHFALVYNRSSLNSYCNGVLKASTAASGTILDSPQDLYIGDTSDGLRTFNGSIDELRIYNRSFSTDEVQILYMSNLKKINSSAWNFYINQSKNATMGLDYGTYTYQAWATDIATLKNTTGQRNITLIAGYNPNITSIQLNQTINNTHIVDTYSNNALTGGENITAQCTAYDGLLYSNSMNVSLIADNRTLPNVTLIEPYDGYTIISYNQVSISFGCNATDSDLNVTTMSLVVNGDTYTESTDNINKSISFLISGNSNITWYCTAKDEDNNVGTSETRTIILYDQLYLQYFSDTGGDDSGSIAITIFILVITGGLFILPFVTRFSEKDWLNLIFKRSCWVVAIYLMVLNSSIMATIAQSAGLPLTQEMFRYMWLFSVGGYLMMGYLVISTLLNVLKMWKIKKEGDRVGYY